MKDEQDMIYLNIEVKHFPITRKDKGYYIFIDRMKEGSANTLERNVLECKQKGSIRDKIKYFISNYKEEYNYLKLWHI